MISNKKYETLRVDSGLKEFTDLIIANSWVKQPELALGAAISLFAVLASRKFIYQGLAPNVYIANISPSGTGKSFPQEEVKKVLVDMQAERLIGAGDYVSYAAIMDSLSTKPVRLDIWDELGGILKTINKGGGEYTAKMDDILAELYTTSNSHYMGRQTAEGNKGSCYRPNVNILGSTTPKGFMEGVTKAAIDKGLLGRFLIFNGDPKQPAQRVKKRKKLSTKFMNHVRWLVSYQAEESDIVIKDIPQLVTELHTTKEADEMLDKIFTTLDQYRIENQNAAVAPIVARLYQQMIKLVIIHAVSRSFREVPVIDKHDVLFGYELITIYSDELEGIVNGLIFDSHEEKVRHTILQLIKDNGGYIKKSELLMKTSSMNRNKRRNAIDDLQDSAQIKRDIERNEDGGITEFYLSLIHISEPTRPY